MRKRDTVDVLVSLLAFICDTSAVFGGFLLATWIRFDSQWIPLFHGLEAKPDDLYSLYGGGAAVGALLVAAAFRALGLYVRPQLGRFENKIPRLVRGAGIGILVCIVAASTVQNWYTKVSSLTFLISFLTVPLLVLIERYILYRIEWNLARHSNATNRVLILGTDHVAAHIKRTIKKESMLRSKVAGFLRTDLSQQDEGVPADEILGTIEELDSVVAAEHIDRVILTTPNLGHDRIVRILLLCDQNMMTFNMVPDLFRIMTSSMDVQSLDDIPLLGVKEWPLDRFWNRLLKRAEDILGAIVGLLFSVPIMAVAAILIKRDSDGPVFFRQERCGEGGKRFNLVKLRTMRIDAEDESGPVWTTEDDPRRTNVGAVLRRLNLDELPQFWNVLKGDMSLVGPRPERPHFVEQFREDIGRYMWRHVSKPGISGWAQINGLRGNTSIEERIKYDLYYLENWSLSFDFKILIKTLSSMTNAY